MPVLKEAYSPFVGDDYPNRVFWGDTHLHTSYSTDAGMIGNVLGPDEAYRFAKGEIVTASNGLRARLLRPLDWLVVAPIQWAVAVAAADAPRSRLSPILRGAVAGALFNASARAAALAASLRSPPSCCIPRTTLSASIRPA